MIEQIVSLVAACLILVAYLGAQIRKFSQNGLIYLLLNLVGSVILSVVAVRAGQWGLTLMEGAWAIITVISLTTVLYKSLLKS